MYKHGLIVFALSRQILKLELNIRTSLNSAFPGLFQIFHILLRQLHQANALIVLYTLNSIKKIHSLNTNAVREKIEISLQY